MGLLEYPKAPCQACQKPDFWYQGNSNWVCMNCHAPVGDPKIFLVHRARLANRKLYLAWHQLYVRPDEKQVEALKGVPMAQVMEVVKEETEMYKAACARAHDIGEQLKAQGFTDCLYIENGKKLKPCNVMPTLTSKPSWAGFFCHSCPNDYWPEKEILDYDRKMLPEAWV